MEIWMGYDFFHGKIIFPSAPVPGINNDQSLKEQDGLVNVPVKIRFDETFQFAAGSANVFITRFAELLHQILTLQLTGRKIARQIMNQ